MGEDRGDDEENEHSTTEDNGYAYNRLFLYNEDIDEDEALE